MSDPEDSVDSVQPDVAPRDDDETFDRAARDEPSPAAE
jgi:hypothetical protein